MTALDFDETDDLRSGLLGSEATMGNFSETDDSRFGLIGSEAIMVRDDRLGDRFRS